MDDNRAKIQSFALKSVDWVVPLGFFSKKYRLFRGNSFFEFLNFFFQGAYLAVHVG